MPSIENNSAKAVYVKINNEWILVKKVYKKIIFLLQINIENFMESYYNYYITFVSFFDYYNQISNQISNIFSYYF